MIQNKKVILKEIDERTELNFPTTQMQSAFLCKKNIYACLGQNTDKCK